MIMHEGLTFKPYISVLSVTYMLPPNLRLKQTCCAVCLLMKMPLNKRVLESPSATASHCLTFCLNKDHDVLGRKIFVWIEIVIFQKIGEYKNILLNTINYLCVARFLVCLGHDKLTFAAVKMIYSSVMSGPGLFQKVSLGFI